MKETHNELLAEVTIVAHRAEAQLVTGVTPALSTNTTAPALSNRYCIPSHLIQSRKAPKDARQDREMEGS